MFRYDSWCPSPAEIESEKHGNGDLKEESNRYVLLHVECNVVRYAVHNPSLGQPRRIHWCFVVQIAPIETAAEKEGLSHHHLSFRQ